jgi:hypothetical protein
MFVVVAVVVQVLGGCWLGCLPSKLVVDFAGKRPLWEVVIIF